MKSNIREQMAAERYINVLEDQLYRAYRALGHDYIKAGQMLLDVRKRYGQIKEEEGVK